MSAPPAGFERLLYLGVIVGLTIPVVAAAQTQVELERRVAVPPADLYATLMGAGAKPQVIDLRTLEADDDADDDVGGYEDTHIPGAIPFPGCDPDRTPPAAMERILSSAPTVIVTTDGDGALFERCAGRFSRVRQLQGGMAAWLDAGLAEDFGEYVPPKAGGAGGGCL